MMETADIYNVSRETNENLITFRNMVLEWNNKFNLISKSSIDNIWERHILDSLQLCRYLTKDYKKLYDFGSGAGFPGIVLAIVAKETFPELKINLIESIQKKAAFLTEVKNKLNLNVEINNDRIENLKLPKADIITSRAMASLEKLLKYAHPFCKKETLLMFLKGQKWQEEVKIAQQNWFFDINSAESLTGKDGRVLFIKNIRRK